MQSRPFSVVMCSFSYASYNTPAANTWNCPYCINATKGPHQSNFSLSLARGGWPGRPSRNLSRNLRCSNNAHTACKCHASPLNLFFFFFCFFFFYVDIIGFLVHSSCLNKTSESYAFVGFNKVECCLHLILFFFTCAPHANSSVQCCFDLKGGQRDRCQLQGQQQYSKLD